MQHIMLDLETMSSSSRAAIISIGAVTFGHPDKDHPKETFYQAIDPVDSQRFGHIDAGTFVWWMNQSDDARLVFTEECCGFLDALKKFSEFCAQFDNVCIWGNGADFDNVVLRNAYCGVGYDAPWSFKNNRCYRTLKGLRPDIEFKRCGVAHNALADAISQAFHAEKILSAIGVIQ